MRDKAKSDQISEQALEKGDREVQRSTLERVLSKTKAKLSPEERQSMDDLVAELDLLHFRQREMEQRLKDSPELKDLILLAQEEEDQEAKQSLPKEQEVEPPPAAGGSQRYDLTPYEKKGTPSLRRSGIARIPKPESSDAVGGVVLEPKLARDPSASQKETKSTPSKPTRKTEKVSQTVKKVTATPAAQPSASLSQTPESKLPPAPSRSHKETPVPAASPGISRSHTTPDQRPVPDLTVRKFIESWNQKAFTAEYACLAKRARSMDKDAYVDRRMDIYLSETQSTTVTQHLGAVHSKKTHGSRADILCDRIVKRGSNEDVFLENYALCLEDGEWRILDVRSSPGKPKRTKKIIQPR